MGGNVEPTEEQLLCHAAQCVPGECLNADGLARGPRECSYYRKKNEAAERGRERYVYVQAFVAGVKWWEYKKTGATLWPDDRNAAEAEAIKRFDAKKEKL